MHHFPFELHYQLHKAAILLLYQLYTILIILHGLNISKTIAQPISISCEHSQTKPSHNLTLPFS